mgnify:CR=1 FL=1
MINVQKWHSKHVRADFGTTLAIAGQFGRSVEYSMRIPKFAACVRFKTRSDAMFVWVMKSAETSIYKSLNEKISLLKLKEPFAVRGGFLRRGPATFGQMDLMNKGWVNADYLERAFSFAVVRNSYNRVQSLFTYLKKRNRVERDFTAFLATVAQSVEPAGIHNSLGISQANPQCRWVKNWDGSILVDEFWKLKELEIALPSIRGKAGASGAPAILTRSLGQPVEMPARAVALIQDIYQESFKIIGFSFDPMTAKRT